jgi:hypothetical protein
MDARSRLLRNSLSWLLTVGLLAMVLDRELRHAAALDESLRAPPSHAVMPITVALLPEYPAAHQHPAATETAARPLFNPTRRPAPPPAPTARPEAQRSQLVLVGTTVSQEESVALLRDGSGQGSRAVRKGDRINGMLVVDIRPDRVKLAASGRAEDVVLKPATASRPAAAQPTPQGSQAAGQAQAMQSQNAPARVFQTPIPGFPAYPPPGAQAPVADPAVAAPRVRQPEGEPEQDDEASDTPDS